MGSSLKYVVALVLCFPKWAHFVSQLQGIVEIWQNKVAPSRFFTNLYGKYGQIRPLRTGFLVMWWSDWPKNWHTWSCWDYLCFNPILVGSFGSFWKKSWTEFIIRLDLQRRLLVGVIVFYRNRQNKEFLLFQAGPPPSPLERKSQKMFWDWAVQI